MWAEIDFDTEPFQFAWDFAADDPLDIITDCRNLARIFEHMAQTLEAGTS